MKYLQLFENKLRDIIGKDVHQLMTPLMEGGNLAIGSHEAQHLDLKVTERNYMVPRLNALLHAINNGFAASTGQKLWSDQVLTSGQFLSGSSLHFFNVKGISDETFVSKKPTVGDIDTMVDKTKEIDLQQYLSSVENKRVGQAVFLGFQRGNEQFSGLFELSDPPVKVQIDFEFVDFENDVPTDWARFSHSSSWDDLQSGIKGVFHKWLIRALAGLSKQSFYQRKMVGRGKLRKEEDVPVTDKMYSFAVSSKEGGGLRPKYQSVLDPETNKPLVKDGLPVMQATSTAGYERNIGKIFKNLLGIRLSSEKENQISQKFWSFTGLLDVINELLSPEEKQMILSDFLEITIGSGSQGMYKNNPDKDIKEKMAAINLLLAKLHLSAPANLNQMLKTYRENYKMTADEAKFDNRHQEPSDMLSKMAKRAIDEEAPSYRRQGIQHLYNPGNSMEIKDIDFIQLCKEIAEDGSNLKGAKFNVKIDGAGIRFGKDKDGRSFFMTSKVTDPKYIENYGDFEAYGKNAGQSDERLAFTKNYDQALKTILNAPFMKVLPADTIVQAEMLFNPMAKKNNEGYTFVNIPYDPKKLGSLMTLVPIFVKQYSTGETRPDSAKIKQELISSSDSRIKIVNNNVSNNGINVESIVQPIVDHAAELNAALKVRGQSPAKQKAQSIIAHAKKALSEAIMKSEMAGKDALGDIIEGIVVSMPNGRLLKITSDYMKEKMAAKQIKQSDSVEKRTGPEKVAVVAVGSAIGHIGHQQLFKHVVDIANRVGGDPYMFIGPAEGPDDPIPPSVKVQTWHQLYPQYAKNISTVTHDGGTLLQKIKHELINPQPGKPPRYDKIYIVVGGDREKMATQFSQALSKVKKFPGYEHVEIIPEITARDEQSGGTGMSGTALRNILKTGTPEQAFAMWKRAYNDGSYGAQTLSDDWIKHLMAVARKNMGIDDSGELKEADNPNYFGGSSQSAIPGTPADLQPHPDEEEVEAYRKEMAVLKRFMGR